MAKEFCSSGKKLCDAEVLNSGHKCKILPLSNRISEARHKQSGKTSGFLLSCSLRHSLYIYTVRLQIGVANADDDARKIRTRIAHIFIATVRFVESAVAALRLCVITKAQSAVWKKSKAPTFLGSDGGNSHELLGNGQIIRTQPSQLVASYR